MEVSQLSRKRLAAQRALERFVRSVGASGDVEMERAIVDALVTGAAAERKRLDGLTTRQARLSRELSFLEQDAAAALSRAKASWRKPKHGSERAARHAKLLVQAGKTKAALLSEIHALTEQIRLYDDPSDTPAQEHADPASVIASSSPALRDRSPACEPDNTLVDNRLAARRAANLFHRQQTELSAVRREYRLMKKRNDVVQQHIDTLRAGGAAADALFAELQGCSRS